MKTVDNIGGEVNKRHVKTCRISIILCLKNICVDDS